MIVRPCCLHMNYLTLKNASNITYRFILRCLGSSDNEVGLIERWPNVTS